MHTAGVDLGGTKVQGVVIGADGARLGEARGKTPVEGGPAAVVAEITGVVKAAAKAAKVPVGKLAGVGIGSPGRIDPDTGDLFGAANLPGFGDPVPLGTMVADALGVKSVVVDNDVVVATLAEHRLGAGRGFDDLLCVFAGSGVGGASSSAAGCGPAPTGRPARSATWWWSTAASCACGRRGCMEAYAGRIALERTARAAAAAGRPTELLAIQERLRRPG